MNNQQKTVTTETPRHPDRLSFLDCIRGVAALAVLVEHIGALLWPRFHVFVHNSFNFGKFGVAAFFLTSGFVIPFSLERGNSLPKFWISRFFRLYPLYWLSLTMVVCLFLLGVPHGFGPDFSSHLARNVLVNVTMFQQFVGINAVLYYAPLMFQNMGATTNSALWQTIIVGLANTVFTVIAILTVDRLGRRPLLIVGALAMATAMLLLGFLFQTRAVGAAALAAVVVYIAGFALSWGPVTWVLLAEMFPNSIKNRAMAIAVAAQWVANLFVSWSFKVLDGSSALNAVFNHGFAYWVYGVMSLLAGLFVYFYVPETKRRTLEGIQSLWLRS